jgi:hypothetical protein
MIEEKPFSSVKVLCRHCRIGRDDVLVDPSRQVWLEKFHLRWVPHVLSISQKSKRVSYSKLFSVWRHWWNTGFQRIVTQMSHGSPSITPLIQFRRRRVITSSTHQTEKWYGKRLVSILRWVDGIHCFLDIPKRTTHSTMLFSDASIINLIENIWSWT